MSKNKKHEVELNKSIHPHVLHANKTENIIFGMDNKTKAIFTVQLYFTGVGIKGDVTTVVHFDDTVNRVSALIVNFDKIYYCNIEGIQGIYIYDMEAKMQTLLCQEPGIKGLGMMPNDVLVFTKEHKVLCTTDGLAIETLAGSDTPGVFMLKR